MRPGSPGFVGVRLREAREARGLSQTGLADALDLSRQLIGQYESGRTTPGPAVAMRLASQLRLPLSFFWLPPDREEVNPVFYRSLEATAKAERATGARRLGWLRRIVLYLQEFVDFPDVHIPTLPVPHPPTALSSDAIDDLALQVRREWGLGDGPISNVLWLLENSGAIIARAKLNAATLDGLSGWLGDGQRPYIFLGTDKQAAVRSRFDVAHELGHLAMHRYVPKQTFQAPEIHRLCESQADIFASAFLLPAQSFARDLRAPTLDSMRAIKSKWRVSIRAMIMRAQSIDLLSQDEARKLHIALTRRGWRQREPLDDDLAPEEPRVLRRSFALLAEAGVKTPAEIREALCLDPADIIELAGLEDDYFGDPPPVVRLIKGARTTPPSSFHLQGVLPFPSHSTKEPTHQDEKA